MISGSQRTLDLVSSHAMTCSRDGQQLFGLIDLGDPDPVRSDTERYTTRRGRPLSPSSFAV